MAELFDAEHNPVEGALTAEEVEEKLETIRKESETAKEDEVKGLQETVTDLEKTIADKDKEIEEVGKKGFNFKALENDRNKVKEELEVAKGELKKIVDGVKTEFDQKKVDDSVNALAGDNKELAEKIKFHFNDFKPDEEKDPTKKEENFKKRMENAYILATGMKPTSPLTGPAISSGGGETPLPGKGKPGKISEGGSEVGEKMGISKEEQKQRGLID